MIMCLKSWGIIKEDNKEEDLISKESFNSEESSFIL